MNWAAFVAWFKAIWPSLLQFIKLLGAGGIGAGLQQGADAKETIEKVMDGSKKAAAARGWSADDRMRFLEQRGRVRNLHE